jgi:hypothetical protein
LSRVNVVQIVIARDAFMIPVCATFSECNRLKNVRSASLPGLAISSLVREPLQPQSRTRKGGGEAETTELGALGEMFTKMMVKVTTAMMLAEPMQLID